jgi:hypothetical protein
MAHSLEAGTNRIKIISMAANCADRIAAGTAKKGTESAGKWLRAIIGVIGEKLDISAGCVRW